MTNQEKRDKVIKGLECVVNDMQAEIDEWRDYSDSELAHELTCDCDWWYNAHQKLANALALLKAQEPNEDWISRKRLKDEIQYYIDEAGWGDEVNKVLGWCMEFIDNQRAVKSE